MALSTESRFFGLDLNQLKADVLKTWRKAPQWPPLSWLRPEQVLTLVPASGDGLTAVWESGKPAPESLRKTDFWAIELPENMVLRKNLQLPSLDAADCASAAQLEVQAISPFVSTDLLWGYTELARSDKAVRLQLVLASRALAEPFVQSRIAERSQAQQGEGQALAQPEVWVFAPARKPVVLQGFGEQARADVGRKKLLWNVAGIGVALLLLVGVAVTPTLQLRLRAIEAVHAYEAIAAKTNDVVKQREQLMQSADKVAGLTDLLSERIDSVKVLSMLTQVLPDDTALQSVRVQGSKVTINGLTENASTLMQKLSNQDGVKDVRAPSAATRMGGVNRESFTIELSLDGKVYGPTLKRDDSLTGAANGQKQAEATEGNSPIAPPAPPVVEAPAAPIAAPQAPVKSAGPSLGGSSVPKATLGGSKAGGPSLGGSKAQPSQGGH
ncbi:MAG: PilN domain-containing protein [Comamonas sp.]